MNEIIQFVIEHAYSLVFVSVLADQIGVPVPSSPMLLAAGTLAGRGWVLFLPSFLLGVGASLTSNMIWYWIGWRKGGSGLSFLCRISLNPDSCVRNTASLFSRYGAPLLLVAKFIPGLNTLAPPLAGIVRMPLAIFLAYDVLGAGIWVGSLIGIGYAFGYEIEALFGAVVKKGYLFGALLLGGLAVFVGWKYVQRRNFIRRIQMARIGTEELKEKIDRGEDLAIFDVRHPMEFHTDPRVIPGAVYAPLEGWKEEDYSRIKDREVIVYCG
jgi:membrane protein DedA with SNARE-associated domain